VELSLQQERFVEEFLKDPNTTATDRKVRSKAIHDAVLRAGYSAGRVHQRMSSIMRNKDVLDAIQRRQFAKLTAAAELTPDLNINEVREFHHRILQHHGLGAWQAQAILKCLELESRYCELAEQRAEAQKREGLTSAPDADLELRISQLENKLGIAQPPPRAEPPPAPEPKPVIEEKKKIAEPPPAPESTYIAGQVHCDKHGLFTPRAKMDPACPACKLEWEAANKRDAQYLAGLLPGVM